MLFKGLFQLTPVLRLSQNSAVLAANRDQAPATLEKIPCGPLVRRAILHPFMHPLTLSAIVVRTHSAFSVMTAGTGLMIKLKSYDSTMIRGWEDARFPSACKNSLPQMVNLPSCAA